MIYDYDNERGHYHPSLNTICAAYRVSSSEHDLPSWVPDWSVAATYWLFDLSEYDSQQYHAAKTEPFLDDLLFDADDGLTCEAVIWDEIACLGRTWTGSRDQEDKYQNIALLWSIGNK